MFRNGTNRWRKAIVAIAGVATIVTGGHAIAAGKKQPKGDVYPLDTCVVTGQKLGSMGDPVIHQHEGREIRFCCKGCVAKFKSNPATYLQKIDKAVVKRQMPHYPVKTCVVTGEKLGGAMGKPIDYVYKNRLVRFCCKGCVQTFTKQPAKHLAKLDKAVVAKQAGAYPLDTCVVLGGKLGAMGKPVDYVTGNRLVRFCCKGCVKAFEKEPAKHLAKLDKARKAAGHDMHDMPDSHTTDEAEGAHEEHGDAGEHSEHGMHGQHMGRGGNSGHMH